MNAFITGSRAYGTPTRDSDVDLVIRADEGTRAMLERLSEHERKCLFGRLNLIVCTDDESFTAWKFTTLKMLHDKNGLKLGSFSRDEAQDEMEQIRKMIGISYGEESGE